MRKRFTLFLALFSAQLIIGISVPVVMAATHPEAPTDICGSSELSTSSFCGEKVKGENVNPLTGQDSIPAKITSLIITLTGAISVIMVIIGGLRYAAASGDQNGVKGAKDTILYALIGLVVAILAQVIVSFVLSKL